MRSLFSSKNLASPDLCQCLRHAILHFIKGLVDDLPKAVLVLLKELGEDLASPDLCQCLRHAVPDFIT